MRERPLGIHLLRLNAEHAADLGAEILLDQVGTLRGVAGLRKRAVERAGVRALRIGCGTRREAAERRRRHRHGGKVGEPLPVDAGGHHVGAVGLQQRRQRRKRLVGREGAIALPAEVFGDLGMARDVAGILHHAPVHRERRPALRPAVMRERIEAGVGCRVVRLHRIAEDRGDRRIEDEQVERLVARLAMQVPGAGQFRRQHLLEALTAHLGKRRIVEHHGAVDDAAERRQPVANVLHDAPDVVAPRNVAAQILDTRAGTLLQIVDLRLRLRRELAARHQDDRRRALLCQPARRRERKAAGPAADQVGACADRLALVHDLQRRIGVAQHDLAHVPGLRHVAHRLLGLGDREHEFGQRPVDALLEVAHHLAQHLAGELGTLVAQPVEIDGEERDVLAERQQADAAVAIDVALADLDEAAVGPQDARCPSGSLRRRAS